MRRRGGRQQQLEHEYDRYAAITGPLQDPPQGRVRVAFRPALPPGERIATGALVLLSALSGIGLVTWLLLPERIPLQGRTGAPIWLGLVVYGMIIGIEVLRVLQGAAIWVLSSTAQDPIPLRPPADLRVAVLTTVVPASEPLDVIATTLRAMRRIRHEGPVDVWILDEGDDPRVRALAADLGVHHFSRHGVPAWNTGSGPFKARTKHGNHNAWRSVHAEGYDVVAQMDPDHVPLPDFLERTLGYFRDPDVGFVVAPQVYGNKHRNRIAGAAARQSYLFHGVVQRGLNGLRIPLLIGTNHLYRVRAWAEIGGYGDSIIEDHMTWLAINASRVHPDGGHWYGVYTPDIVSVGEGPTTWTDWFNQQRRWAFGMWEIILGRGTAFLGRLRPLQRLYVASLQLFYPSVGMIWALGLLAASTSLIAGVDALETHVLRWLPWWGTNAVIQVALFLRFKRWYLTAEERVEHQRDAFGLGLVTAPIYAAAMGSALAGRPLRYVVTAKGALASPDGWRTFRPHLGWAVLAAVALTTAAVAGHDQIGPAAWATLGLLVALAAPALALRQRWGRPDRAAGVAGPSGATRARDVVDDVARIDAEVGR